MVKGPEGSNKLIYAEAKLAMLVVNNNLRFSALKRIKRKNLFHGAEDCNRKQNQFAL